MEINRGHLSVSARSSNCSVVHLSSLLRLVVMLITLGAHT